MAPDLNSLPPSNSPHRSPSIGESLSPNITPPSPRSSSHSLAAAASINAGMQNDSRRSSTSSTRPRNASQASPSSPRRSNVAMRINLNDPAIPGPGELHSADRRSPQERHSPRVFRASPQSMGSPDSRTADPHHHRTPSLGELHQELEQEQEAHVNRLLQMIRQQQIQLQQLQSTHPNSTAAPQSGSAIETETPSSERSISFTPLPPQQPSSTRTRSPAAPHRASRELSRQNSYRSRRSSRDYSPNLRPLSGSLYPAQDEAVRDESAFYQAETQTLTRENQMLRVRIRELEKLLAEAKHSQPGEPAVASNLVGAHTEATPEASA